MKLLIFAAKPPPFSGQSFMVQLVLEKLGGDVRTAVTSPAQAPAVTPEFECYHIDARLSDNVQQVSVPSVKKVFRLLKYCFEAIWCRFRYGIPNLYFIPAHGARTSMVRDWLALAICRPFFKTLIYHWHAAGAGEWLETTARPWERRLARAIMGRPNLSIVLLAHNRNDADAFGSRRVEVIANGIPDPCPRFDSELGPRRRRRTLARRKLLAGEKIGAGERMEVGEDLEVFKVLFLSLCCREKGLFDALEAVARANQQLGRAPVRVELSVAGTFPRREILAEFETRLREPDLNQSGPLVRYIGFVSGEEKTRLLASSDCLCFPTYYSAESFGIVLLEAMAFGLPVITTRWRGLDELLPPSYAGVVDLRSPDQIATRLQKLMREEYDDSLRRKFEAGYTDEVLARNIRVALLSLK